MTTRYLRTVVLAILMVYQTQSFSLLSSPHRHTTRLFSSAILDPPTAHTFKRHPLFSETNILTRKTSPPSTWSQILPTGVSTRGLDVQVTFDDPLEGAHELLSKCDIEDNNTMEHLHSCLKFYHDVVGNKPCKARIVATRGQSGVKCPRWHIDHVPVRLIMALEGPGVCYVSNSHKEMVNHSDEVNTDQANRDILKEMGSNIKVHMARKGELVLMMGKEWEDSCCGIMALMHKSPILMPFQGRVLLSVDVLQDVLQDE